MKTTITNQKVIDLITRAFDANGFLIHPTSRKNQNEAKAFLESHEFEYEEVNGLDIHDSLLIIAYPNKSI